MQQTSLLGWGTDASVVPWWSPDKEDLVRVARQVPDWHSKTRNLTPTTSHKLQDAMERCGSVLTCNDLDKIQLATTWVKIPGRLRKYQLSHQGATA